MYKGNYSEFAQKLIPFMDGIKYVYTKTNFKIFLSMFFVVHPSHLITIKLSTFLEEWKKWTAVQSSIVNK